MINESFVKERASQIVDKFYLNEEQPNYEDERIAREGKRCFIRGVNFAEAVIENAFHKSCDDLEIGYEKQQRILKGMKQYLS